MATIELKKNHLFNRHWFIKQFNKIAYYGVDKEKNESNQKYVIQVNLISVATFLINGITGLLFFFIIDTSPGISFMLSAFMWLSAMYINRNGLKVSSRVLFVFLSLAALLAASCWYTHHTLLDNYFLIVAVNSALMYSPQERKWQMASLLAASAIYIIESTALQNYLPAYNKLPYHPATNIVLLSGEVMTILMDVIIYAYINDLREKSLLAKQDQLEQTQARVQTQNDDLKTFSIAASHTMQTPLYVASFFLDKMELELSNNDYKETQNNIQLVKNGLQQMEQLISGLFSYNRIINIENESALFNAVEEINLVKQNILLRYPQANIIINKNEFLIAGNQLLFSTIIYNLIDNGIKYNVDVPHIHISCGKTKAGVIVLVTDNGIGIPGKYLTSIFQPFKRIQNDGIFKAGNGLGLACAKRAAERMQGTLICLQSSSNGTVFKLELPL